ncbi:MAG: hypothetical protein PHV23_02725 [Candidatus Gracilibacteria bacterium]|nr:hypothetical protein [Candidatus Gracilibacteria bacterium]
MKRIVLILVIVFLSSCDLDKNIDNSQSDNDDINIIDKVGKQSLDKAIDLYDTKTRAS